MDLPRPGSHKDFGALAHRRAGGKYVIYQQDIAGNRPARPESAPDILPPSGPGELYLISGPPHDF